MKEKAPKPKFPQVGMWQDFDISILLLGPYTVAVFLRFEYPFAQNNWTTTEEKQNKAQGRDASENIKGTLKRFYRGISHSSSAVSNSSKSKMSSSKHSLRLSDI